MHSSNGLGHDEIAFAFHSSMCAYRVHKSIQMLSNNLNQHQQAIKPFINQFNRVLACYSHVCVCLCMCERNRELRKSQSETDYHGTRRLIIMLSKGQACDINFIIGYYMPCFYEWRIIFNRKFKLTMPTKLAPIDDVSVWFQAADSKLTPADIDSINWIHIVKCRRTIQP